MPSKLSLTAPVNADLEWRDGFASLGSNFFTRVAATPLPAPHWVARNAALAAALGIDTGWFESAEALTLFSGNAPGGSEPLASVYSGHQFGVWAGQLGDGRALLLGTLDTPVGPMELQLKGAGQTPYSRMGDGRAVLRSSIREFLCSEAMHALGIPTTRALCITGSPQPVRRETVESAAVVTRVAETFIRFGHFEHFANADPGAGARDDLRRLADHVIDRHFAHCRDAPNAYAELLSDVARRTARLMAQWQAVGFCHGVMNTDNMSILGLTIDYGPFGFLDAFDPGHICNHSDTQGRYAWARQPNVAFWNLHALAQAMLPLIGEPSRAIDAIEPYKTVYAESMLAAWCAKLGLRTRADDDRGLVDDWLGLMASSHCDFSIAFRRLASWSTVPDAPPSSLRNLFIDRPAFDAWAVRYTHRLQRERSVDAERALSMNQVNPKYVLRNHMAERAIQDAREGDFTETRRLLRVLERPFDEQDDDTSARYAGLPPDWAQSIEVSCSS